jgi:O-antigen/teichoic acid export membrane protein
MSRTRRILGAAGVGYVHQAAVILVGLWLTPFLLARIGQHDLGLWLVTGQLLGYLALMDLGVLAILPREVAFASGHTAGREHINSLVAYVRGIVRWQVVGLAAICAGLWLLLPAAWAGLRWPLAWVLGAFVVAYPLRIPSAVLQGLQDLPYLAKAQMAGWAAGSAVTVLLVMFQWRLSALVAGWIVTLLVPAVAAVWRLRNTFSWIDRGTAPATGTSYFSRSIWVSVGQVAQVFLSGSDVLLIGRLLGAAAVVPYSCTGKLVTVFTNHPQLLMHAAQPALTELRASGSRERLTAVARALTDGMLIMSGALVVIVVTANHFFVNWWVGPAQFGGLGLTVALAAMMLLRHWNVATIYTLFCFGYERQLSLTNLADGLVSLAATLWLVAHYGVIGAPLASILSAVLVSLPVNLRSVAREMDLSIARYVAPFFPLMLSIAGVIAVGAASAWWFDTAHLTTAVLTASSVFVLYVAVVVPFVLSGPLRPYARTALSMLRPRLSRACSDRGAFLQTASDLPPAPLQP